jgi:hypothetical protein
MQKSIPWLVSITFHLGLFLIIAFVVYATSRALNNDADHEIVIPTSFTDPALSPTPGPTAPGTGGDPAREAAQNNLKDLLKSDGWSQAKSPDNVAGLLEGQTAQNDVDFFARGTGGGTGAGTVSSGNAGGGPAAPYGAAGGGSGPGFKSSFYGTGGNANRIVYIIDHSGSMMDNFDYLKVETKRSVSQLVPLQFFSVIMVSDTAAVSGAAQLQRAVPDAKAQIIAKLEDFVAEGQNDDLLPPFQEAFQKAFDMHPQLIYFLTDGHFDPRLADVVQQLNRQHKVHINTLAFVNHEASYEDQLQNLAKKNGGVYKFISERDAQGQ